MSPLRRELLLLRQQFLLQLMRVVERRDRDNQAALVWLDRRVEFVEKKLREAAR